MPRVSATTSGARIFWILNRELTIDLATVSAPTRDVEESNVVCDEYDHLFVLGSHRVMVSKSPVPRGGATNSEEIVSKYCLFGRSALVHGVQFFTSSRGEAKEMAVPSG